MNINTSLMDESLTGAEVCSSIRDTRTMCGISDEDCGNCGKVMMSHFEMCIAHTNIQYIHK